MRVRNVASWFLLIILSGQFGLEVQQPAYGESAKFAAKPNILWLIAEDMGPELSCYGTPGVSTPVLDELAAQGMRYTNAFTVTPVCSTSRSSFMTGMYAMSIDAHNHRSYRNGENPLPDGVKTLPQRLRQAGYFTANVKKLTDDRSLSRFYRGTGKTDWNFSLPPGEKPFDSSNWDDLKSHQPFYAQVNFSETHRGREWNTSHEQIAQRADPEDIELPPYYPDHSVARAVWCQYLNTVMAVDKKIGFVLELLRRDGLADNTVIVFLGDHGRAMPRGKQWPYDSGLHIPLIIHWPTNTQQFPIPAGFQPGGVSEQLIASIDLTASTLDWAGIRPPANMQGQIFLGKNAQPPRDAVFGGRDRGDETVFHSRTIRTDRYRYIRNQYPQQPFLALNRYKETQYPMIGLLRYLKQQGRLTGPPVVLLAPSRPVEELYDLQTDPWEIHNLAADPAFAQIRQLLADRLTVWQNTIDDDGRVPEPAQLVEQIEIDYERKYRERMSNRPADWFLTHPAVGPYPVQLEK